jgi:cytochrome c peroxidase
LSKVLIMAGFTGRVEAALQERLSRPLNPRLTNLGRLLWFDTITALNDDNSCSGCHSPTNGFGDTQSIAIGIDNNGIVGPHRSGPRNMRRTPTAINSAFYPSLMWNSRFVALSGNPFDNRSGFLFPDPEGLSLSSEPHLLVAQAFIPPTERTEAAGFIFQGDNHAIRAEVLDRLNANPEYRKLFAEVFPTISAGAPITYDMFGMAIAEFEFSLTFANAPVDQFARGEYSALREDEKKGALLFFGQAGCVQCHQVAGNSNEMFSDFQNHVAGIPQLVPRVTNNTFDGPDANEDFGREEISANSLDRYAFRTSPLRNVAVQGAFMHDGAFTRLEDALRYHLAASELALTYRPADQQLDPDLTGQIGPIDPLISHLDPALANPISLTNRQFNQLLGFVRCGLLDPRARPENLRKLIPASLPSRRPPLRFEFQAARFACR